MRAITFNNQRSTNFHLAILDSKRPILPKNKDEYIDLPGVSGSVLIADKSLEDVTVTVEFLIDTPENKNLYKLARDIGQWLYTTDRTKLVFDDDPDFIYQAKVENEIMLEKIIRFGKFEVEFRCCPPKYAATEGGV